MRISDWSSDVCSSDLRTEELARNPFAGLAARRIGRDHRLHGADAEPAAEREAPWLQQVAGIGPDDAGTENPAARRDDHLDQALRAARSEEHTSELQSQMRSSYAVFCL